jgi:pyruvate,water dikinase
LRHLAAARAEGLSDDDVVALRPEVLALVPPSIFGDRALPETDSLIPRSQDDGSLPQREALRLRARWVQELSARAARTLADRLHAQGRVDDPAIVSALSIDELETISSLGALPADASSRATQAGPPLPAAFRLTDAGSVVVYRPRKKNGSGGAGTGASAGRGEGTVHSGDGLPQPGQILVVATLDPDLATLLPRLGGLVSETGSVLSHLAIMAREYGVPAVVGVPDALTRFPAGSRVVVDGTTGEVLPAGGDAS